MKGHVRAIFSHVGSILNFDVASGISYDLKKDLTIDR